MPANHLVSYSIPISDEAFANICSGSLSSSCLQIFPSNCKSLLTSLPPHILLSQKQLPVGHCSALPMFTPSRGNRGIYNQGIPTPCESDTIEEHQQTLRREQLPEAFHFLLPLVSCTFHSLHKGALHFTSFPCPGLHFYSPFTHLSSLQPARWLFLVPHCESALSPSATVYA